MFGISGFELFIILLFGFLLFGPDKLPAMARTLGRGIAKFRAAQQDMNDVLKESNAFNPNDDEPFKDPTETIDKLASTAEKHLRSAGSTVKNSVKEKTHDAKPAADSEGAASATAAVAATPAAAAPAKSEPTAATAPSAPDVKNESFTERKARYERERAARLAAEQQAARDASEGGER